MKDSWDKVPGHSYESCKSPRQMESENEMIVISHRLKFESREEWVETRDKTRRHQTSILRSSGIAPYIFAAFRSFDSVLMLQISHFLTYDIFLR